MPLFIDDATPDEPVPSVRLAYPKRWLVDCSTTGCPVTVTVWADDEEHARRSTVARFGWTRDGDDMHCRKHEEGAP